ncbi:hypothetical protein H696_00411 [Fonticula alba]|uniref:BZIP domain-containing protein n=1 Tax=Fonticula alba TaxID=691883 RepID=A0A058ZEK3_FONAL|nr:hypothetical protein H696_00411 [Fonticula alba]KCV72835.1 hypothetical protein H696_00411 [Fonticula alba]|eukprot:XP_009492536.1 hypothetical protein H696_00411 [Fonticula alba]
MASQRPDGGRTDVKRPRLAGAPAAAVDDGDSPQAGESPSSSPATASTPGSGQSTSRPRAVFAKMTQCEKKRHVREINRRAAAKLRNKIAANEDAEKRELADLLRQNEALERERANLVGVMRGLETLCTLHSLSQCELAKKSK